MFLSHLSWKLLSFSDQMLSVVRLSVCKLFTFSTSSPESLLQFQQNFAQSIFGWRGFKFAHMKDYVLFQGEIIAKMWNSIENIQIFFFSRTIGPISTKIGTKHLWIKGILVYSYEGPCPFPRGENSKNVKFYWKYLRSSSPEPLCKFQSNLAQIIHG